MRAYLHKLTVFAIALLVANSSIAQIALRGTAQTANITSGSTLTINKPTGVVAGDIMFLIVSKYNVSTTPSLAGWSTVTATTAIGAIIGNDYASLLYRVADASDASVTSYSFAVGTNTSCAGSIIAFSGVDVTGGVTATGAAGGPFDVQPGSISSTQSTGTPQTITSITTAHANAAVIMFGMEAFITSSTFTAWSTTSPGALTEVNDFQGNPYNGVGAAWATKATAGSTGTSSLTISSSSNYSGGILIALKPISCTPPAAPSVTTPVNLCLNGPSSPLTATGSNLLWYTSSSGGTGSSTAPTPSTSSTGTTSYYVSQTVGCESARAQINVVVGGLPTAHVDGQSNLTCYLSGNGSITVSATGGSGSGYTYSINNGTSYQPSGTFNGLSAGTYKVRVKDGNQCASKSVQ